MERDIHHRRIRREPRRVGRGGLFLFLAACESQG